MLGVTNPHTSTWGKIYKPNLVKPFAEVIGWVNINSNQGFK